MEKQKTYKNQTKTTDKTATKVTDIDTDIDMVRFFNKVIVIEKPQSMRIRSLLKAQYEQAIDEHESE